MCFRCGKADILEIQVLHLTGAQLSTGFCGVADFHLNTHVHTNTDKMSSAYHHNVGCCSCNADELQFSS